MSEQTSSILRIKSDWTLPKYYLGQLVKQGEIVGIRHLPKNSQIALDFGNEPWVYTVVKDNDFDSAQLLAENEILPLNKQQLQTKIQSEIDCYQDKIVALSKQLQEIETKTNFKS